MFRWQWNKSIALGQRRCHQLSRSDAAGVYASSDPSHPLTNSLTRRGFPCGRPAGMDCPAIWFIASAATMVATVSHFPVACKTQRLDASFVPVHRMKYMLWVVKIIRKITVYDFCDTVSSRVRETHKPRRANLEYVCGAKSTSEKKNSEIKTWVSKNNMQI